MMPTVGRVDLLLGPGVYVVNRNRCEEKEAIREKKFDRPTDCTETSSQSRGVEATPFFQYVVGIILGSFGILPRWWW